jgi:hypothetical protein
MNKDLRTTLLLPTNVLVSRGAKHGRIPSKVCIGTASNQT